ncbi:MAG: hypothetical protein ACP5KG_12215, partial [Myxococcota bacterium]
LKIEDDLKGKTIDINDMDVEYIESLVINKILKETLEKDQKKAEDLSNFLINNIVNEVKDNIKRKEIKRQLMDLRSKVGNGQLILNLLSAAKFGQTISSKTISSSLLIHLLPNIQIAGPIITSIGSLVGWNILQVILLKSIIGMFGYWAGAKAALGIGLGGFLMSITSTSVLGPISAAVAALILLYKLGDTNWKIIIPAVFIIGLLRLQKKLDILNSARQNV